MKKLLFIVVIGAAGLVSAKGSVVDNSKVSSAEKYSATKNVNISIEYYGGIICTFLVSVTDPSTGETKQWRETYSVNTKEECANKHSERKAQLQAEADANDSVD
ncbi:hypothetical protein [Elizabethkingia bruuniana]|uniref:Uncharacterized protein n=1 Tax=Elizabethkingia bruuniana TaxID=1756149 RepID=A0A7T7UW19_9FLAO|nr:hypothetical protein [Elizabethkingia bruuniana]KGO08781.1 hypothetical protein KS04_19705 [Elizabethkingia miricola]AQX87271.1 hypothetical protein AYC65_01980 [Elizabethkingia bruuniana]KUY28491.1 hypothetical protein ATB97_14365 [Elizabethkingia bruuniana]OPB64900.1 hypothetical protein BAY12_05620 [Elizabethkingia bruuniana]QDZ64705.1 hypothetical protein EVD20_13500 [Elizabethkingia bruuniana]